MVENVFVKVGSLLMASAIMLFVRCKFCSFYSVEILRAHCHYYTVCTFIQSKEQHAKFIIAAFMERKFM